MNQLVVTSVSNMEVQREMINNQLKQQLPRENNLILTTLDAILQRVHS